LDTFGFNVPIIRPVIGFICLTFIPGLFILYLLKIDTLDIVEKILFSVGLSLVFIIFIGLLINVIYPHLGIDRPLSTWPLIITMTIPVFIMGIFLYRRGDLTPFHIKLHWSQLVSAPTLFLILLPVLAVVGTQLVNLFGNNIVLLILIPLLAVVVIIVIFFKFISPGYYPFALYVIALALLLHSTLISRYLIGYDIHAEYYYANLVLSNQFWDTSIADAYNAMLSITILAPIYSVLCDIELIWIIKIIYPLLFALVPVGLYKLYDQQVNSKVAFLASFFFMSVVVFSIEMTALARQQIAELFLVLLLLAIVNRSIYPLGKIVIFLTFGAALIVSHYSLSYFFMVFLILLPLLVYCINGILLLRSSKGRLKSKDFGKQLNEAVKQDNVSIMSRVRVISANFIIFYIVLCLFWYIFNAGASPFISILYLIQHVSSTFFTELMSLMSSEALWLIATPTVSALHEVTKYLHLFTILLITIGIIDMVLHWNRKTFDTIFATYAVVSFILAVAAIAIPYFAIALNTSRIYHIALIALSPFCIMGAAAITRFLSRKIKIPANVTLKGVSVLLIVFFLFSIGFVYELTTDHPFSISLSQPWIRNYGSETEKVQFYGSYTPEEEVYSARWLSEHMKDDENKSIYANYLEENRIHALTSYGMIPRSRILPFDTTTEYLEDGTYVYLQYLNVKENLGTTLTQPLKTIETFNMDEITILFEGTDKIYSNGGSEILFKP
jgi:uncharacterized membrane protein